VKRALAALALACAAQDAAAQPMQPESASDGRAQWLERPQGEDFVRTYPTDALAYGLEGRVALECRVVAGGKAACGVSQEFPPGWGFGRGALDISPTFRLAETLSDGRPAIGAVVRTTISYRQHSREDFGPDIGDATAAVIWRAAPSASDYALAQPEGSWAAGGLALLRCVVAADGRFERCGVVREEPEDRGVGAAAMRLSPRFQVAMAETGLSAGDEVAFFVSWLGIGP